MTQVFEIVAELFQQAPVICQQCGLVHRPYVACYKAYEQAAEANRVKMPEVPQVSPFHSGG